MFVYYPVYSSTPTGLTLDAATGAIVPSTSTPNTYTVTITYPVCGSCAAVSFTTTVIITSPTTATLSYATPPCTSTTTSVTPTLTGATGATTFTSTPAGLSINATTGAINPSLKYGRNLYNYICSYIYGRLCYYTYTYYSNDYCCPYSEYQLCRYALLQQHHVFTSGYYYRYQCLYRWYI